MTQTDGEPLPQVAGTGGDPGEALGQLKAFVADQQIALEYADDLGGADGLLGLPIFLARHSVGS